MKQWVRKCGGMLFASLLTVLLNGKAYADSEPQPQEAPTKIVEPASGDPAAATRRLSVSDTADANKKESAAEKPDTEKSDIDRAALA